jgi:hypothetical protein
MEVSDRMTGGWSNMTAAAVVSSSIVDGQPQDAKILVNAAVFLR